VEMVELLAKFLLKALCNHWHNTTRDQWRDNR
jgi:hypothetical protein